MLLHIIHEFLLTKFNLTLNLVFRTILLHSKGKLLNTVQGTSETKMVFSNKLSQSVFNCHPRNKTWEGALARDKNWQFKVTIVSLVSHSDPKQRGFTWFSCGMRQLRVLLSLERDAKKTSGYHTPSIPSQIAN